MTDDQVPDFSARVTRTQVTSPAVDLKHFISNDELDILCDTKAGAAKDICLVALGGFFGSIVPAINELANFNSKQYPMGVVGLVTFAIAIAMLIASAVTAWLWYNSEDRHSDMTKRIRERPKFEVR